MKNVFYSILCSIGATAVMIFAIVVFGTQTPLEIYSFNVVQNCLLLFVIFCAASAGIEAFQEIGSLDPIVDLIINLVAAIITTHHYYQQGIFLFDGLTQLRPLLKYISLPLIIIMAISSINFTSKAEKLKG